ncbi:hypothetical protein [Psychrobacter sp. H8-1]|uniref:hypothetical protein n=1 Tax=Psychrobacter sp. H8-1 TaxID=2774129 RepID=UPI00191932B9|nr:hypothetical protein [Psychrobacter sp. H8-1]
MAYLSKIEDKVTIKALLIYILISIWVLGLMIFFRLNESFDVYYAGYGDMPVEIQNDSYGDPVPVEITNHKLDVEVTNHELDVEVTNSWYNAVPVEPR